MTKPCESCPFAACDRCDYQPTVVHWTTPGGTKKTRTFDNAANAQHYRDRMAQHDPTAEVVELQGDQ